MHAGADPTRGLQCLASRYDRTTLTVCNPVQGAHAALNMQNTVTACADQVCLLQYQQRDNCWGPSNMDQVDEMLQIAEQFQDVNLLALTANTKAALMKQKG